MGAFKGTQLLRVRSQQRERNSELEQQSPFVPGTRILKKGWRYVKGQSQPVRGA